MFRKRPWVPSAAFWLAAVLSASLLGVRWVKAGAVGPPVDFLAAGMEDQEARAKSVDVTYTCSFRAVRDSVLVDSWDRKVHYVRTPDARRYELLKNGAPTAVSSYDVQANELRSYSFSSNSGVMDHFLGSPFGNREFLESTSYYIYGNPARDIHGGFLLRRIRQGAVFPEMEKVDGYDCWRVEIPLERGNMPKCTVWLDPSIGFNPRRIEYTMTDDPTATVSFKEYRESDNGSWFPMKTVAEDLETGRDIAYSETNTVESVKVGRTIPKENLIVQFPSGATVTVDGEAEFVVP